MRRKKSLIFKILLFSILLYEVILLTACNGSISPNGHVKETNLNSVEIMTAGNVFEPYIKFNDGNVKKISENHILLFVNGSLVINDRVLFQNEIPMVSLNLVLDSLNIKYKKLDDLKGLIITNDEKIIEVPVNSDTVIIENENLKIGTITKLYNSELYIGIYDLQQLIGAEATYYSHNKENQDNLNNSVYYINNISQIMISRYNPSAEIINADKALETLKKKLVKAYENKYGHFFALNQKPDATTNEKDKFRYIFSHLSVSRENDRFYVVPVIYDFWIDKYSGYVYVYYNGFPKTIKVFNYRADGALDFPG